MVSQGCRFKFLSTSATFLMLPGLGDQPLAVRSTTNDPFSAAAFAIFPKFDPPTKTILPLLCTVGGAAMLREKEGGKREIYILPRSVHLFSCSRIDGPIVGVVKSTVTMQAASLVFMESLCTYSMRKSCKLSVSNYYLSQLN
jgi:hypothetical protein